jgi:hypothetical protein
MEFPDTIAARHDPGLVEHTSVIPTAYSVVHPRSQVESYEEQVDRAGDG